MILLTQKKWTLDREGRKGQNAKFSPVPINRHIASLVKPFDYHHILDDFPESENFFAVFSNSNFKVMYPIEKKYGLEYPNLPLMSKMPDFEDQPLACHSFTGGLDDENTLFGYDLSQPETKSEITAIVAFNTYITNILPEQTFNCVNGKRFKFVGGIAYVLASRASNGSFFRFVERLAYHFSHEPLQ